MTRQVVVVVLAAAAALARGEEEYRSVLSLPYADDVAVSGSWFAAAGAYDGARVEATVVSTAGVVVEETIVAAEVSTEGAESTGVSIALDGDVLAVGVYCVGSTGASSVLFFRRKLEEGWVETDRITNTTDRFGAAVAISGSLAVVGAPGDSTYAGRVLVLESRNDDSWIPAASLVASDATAWDLLGYAVAISGSMVVAGAPGDDSRASQQGAAYIFERANGAWSETAKLVADGESQDYFGSAVGAATDLVVVGASGSDEVGQLSGAAYAFRRNATAAWNAKELVPSRRAAWDHFGSAVAVEEEEEDIAVGAPGHDGSSFQAGLVFVFSPCEGGEEFCETGVAEPPSVEDYLSFGEAVAIDGDLVAVAAPGGVTSWLFTRDASVGFVSSKGDDDSRGRDATSRWRLWVQNAGIVAGVVCLCYCRCSRLGDRQRPDAYTELVASASVDARSPQTVECLEFCSAIGRARVAPYPPALSPKLSVDSFAGPLSLPLGSAHHATKALSSVVFAAGAVEAFSGHLRRRLEDNVDDVERFHGPLNVDPLTIRLAVVAEIERHVDWYVRLLVPAEPKPKTTSSGRRGGPIARFVEISRAMKRTKIELLARCARWRRLVALGEDAGAFLAYDYLRWCDVQQQQHPEAAAGDNNDDNARRFDDDADYVHLWTPLESRAAANALGHAVVVVDAVTKTVDKFEPNRHGGPRSESKFIADAHPDDDDDDDDAAGDNDGDDISRRRRRRALWVAPTDIVLLQFSCLHFAALSGDERTVVDLPSFAPRDAVANLANNSRPPSRRRSSSSSTPYRRKRVCGGGGGGILLA
ncbi:hypothetical protein CTAYLR_002249 [Chrysophaeum taylorii]|uniref:Uncharacterized protein n=1 Tax=Chrysophaeum taylorii TaxID=2483200 RepID=A0AAD7UN25_9STRA|nr:hypothetical protein CTAYLR_002249 [Chrysophaeum taylorii]